MKGAIWTQAEHDLVVSLIAKRMTPDEAAEHLGRTKKGVVRYVAKNRLGPWYRHPTGAMAPEGFAQAWKGNTRPALMARYGVNENTIARWVKETGLKRRENTIPRPRAIANRETADHGRGFRATMVADFREDTAASRAAEVMRQERWIVYRCDNAGNARQGGAFWRLGTGVRTDAELIERAERVQQRRQAV